MTRNPPDEATLRRVDMLSAKQRLLLARRLGLAPGAPRNAAVTLVAYAETSAPAPTEEDLHRFLADRLPDAMIPSAVVLLPSLPRGPTGKVRRESLPDPEPAAAAESDAEFVQPQGEVQEKLARIWADTLGVDFVGVNDNFFELGGDSLLSIRAIARANEAGLHVTPKQFFDAPTIGQLSALVEGSKPKTAAGPVTGPCPLTPIQHWFFEHIAPDPHHWNQAVLLAVSEDDPSVVEQALTSLAEHHDALRLRFERGASGWQAVNTEPARRRVLVVEDLAGLSEAAQHQAIDEVATRMHASCDIAGGMLLQAALFRCGPGHPNRLLIVIHHLAVDPVSWSILLDDLEHAYGQLKQGTAVRLPAKTTSFKEWAERLRQYAERRAVRDELPFWLSEMPREFRRLPIDHPAKREENTVGSAKVITVSLDEADTRALLRDAQQAYKTRVDEFLLTGLLLAFADWTGNPTLVVDVERHGRHQIIDDVDITRTVGWFTIVFPVTLRVASERDPGATLRGVKEHMRSVPNQGVGHGLLRYVREDGEANELRAANGPEVNFNYLGAQSPMGSQSAVFHAISGPTGSARSLRGMRPYLIEVNSAVADGRFRAMWTYSTLLHDRATIQGLADRFLVSLRSLLEHCLAPEVGAATPSDFPLANLDQAALDRVAELLEQTDDSD